MSRRGRILVIDDDPLFRSLIMSVLRKDFLVSVAGDGAEGYYKALEHAPDIAVVDVQMPGWDGLKTLKGFRAHPALNKVPVIMLTSDASKETVLAAINAGAVDYVIKTSFSKEEFLKKLERHLPWRAPQTISHIDARENPAPCPHPRPAAEAAPLQRGREHEPAAAEAPAPRPEPVAAPAPVMAGPIDPRVQELIDDWE